MKLRLVSFLSLSLSAHVSFSSSSSSLLSSHLRVSTRRSFSILLASPFSLLVCASFPAGCAVATVGYGVGVSTDCQSTPLPLLLLLRPTPPLPPPPSGSCAEHIHPGNEVGRDTKEIIPLDPDPCPVTHLLLFKTQLSKIFQLSSVSVSP